jgi:PAS domain S-box-containing protein
MRTILLVEDEMIIAMSEKLVLERHGYQVRLAASGEAAVQSVLDGDPVSLVLMDINLGAGIDGPEAARRILAVRELPVVFLSSHTEPEIVDKTEHISSYGYIVKNSGETELLASIRMAFRLYEARQRELRQEQALAKSEMHFRILADSGQALIWTAGTDKKCDYFNKPWLDFTGSTPEQEIGDGWARHVHPDDMERCVATYVNAFDRREPFSMVYRLQRHDGKYRWIQDDGKPRFDEHGIFFGYIGHCLDVTAHRKAQDHLGELKIGLQASGDGVAVLDNGLRVRYCNDALAAMFGYTVEEITGKSWRHLYDDAQQCFLEETIIPLVARQGSFTGCCQGTRGDGTGFEQEISLNLLDNGGLVCVVRDISEYVRTERQLRVHDEQMRFLSAHLAECVATSDHEGRITWISDSAEMIFGVPPSQMTGHFFTEYLDHTSSGSALDAFREVVDSGGLIAGRRFMMRRNNGGSFEGELSGTSFMGGTLVVIRPVNDAATRASSAHSLPHALPRYLYPAASTAAPALHELVDLQMMKSVMDDLYAVTGIGMAMVDTRGAVLVSTGWQQYVKNSTAPIRPHCRNVWKVTAKPHMAAPRVKSGCENVRIIFGICQARSWSVMSIWVVFLWDSFSLTMKQSMKSFSASRPAGMDMMSRPILTR